MKVIFWYSPGNTELEKGERKIERERGTYPCHFPGLFFWLSTAWCQWYRSGSSLDACFSSLSFLWGGKRPTHVVG